LILPREEWHLNTDHIGRRVLVFDRVDSTSAQAAALADDLAHDGSVILAEEQTAGRGQHGRSWQCERGVGVLLSVLLFPPSDIRRPVILAAWAADAVCEMIYAHTGLSAKIKWPNDVLVHGRKVCGILIEQGCGTVVGIGLNLNQNEEWFTSAGLPQAGSLALFTGQTLDWRETACSLISQLDASYEQICKGDRTGLEARWRRRIGLRGKRALVECLDVAYRGRLLALSWDGLELETPEGEHVHLTPESVRHLLPG
jgi:BirA family biotin operon repressor/biotin-[acetyl-CoA-carboxylase] ligase